MTDAEGGTCRTCGGDLVRVSVGASVRVYHPWDVTTDCSERQVMLGRQMADVDPAAFVAASIPYREGGRPWLTI
jgi:hypothetical protein